MRHVPAFALCFALLAALGCGDSSTTEPQVIDVYTPGNLFSPADITIPVGSTVRFNITGTAAHNVAFTRRPGAPEDVPVVSNVVVSRTFATAGTFPYDCTVHPGMSGEVVVK